MGGSVRFVDLSHPLSDGMDPYPGLPRPRIVPFLDHTESRSRYDGEEFFLGRIDMPANVGTYIDSPFHRFSDREDLAGIPLDRLVGLPAVVIDAAGNGSRSLDPDVSSLDVNGKAVLIRTGWDDRWGTDAYWEPGPYLTEGSADRLVDAGAILVGVDFWNVDDTTTRRRPIHTRLLGAGVLVVEHLCNLDRLPPMGARFSAPVLAIEGGASFPVRAFAEISG